MSMAIKSARMRYAGDPGLFGALGRIVKGAAGVVGRANIPLVSGVARTVSDIIPTGAPRTVPNVLPQPVMRANLAAQMPRQGPTNAGPGGSRINLPFFGAPGAGISIGERASFEPGATVACPAGYRPNKSSYFLKSGEFVPKGTRCVKVRRRNPLNPRAADRAISRITSAKKAAAKLNRITVRKSC